MLAGRQGKRYAVESPQNRLRSANGIKCMVGSERWFAGCCYSLSGTPGGPVPFGLASFFGGFACPKELSSNHHRIANSHTTDGLPHERSRASTYLLVGTTSS